MKLPIAWLMDYLPEHLRGAEHATDWESALVEACQRWQLEPAADPAVTLGRLMTFAGFALDGIHGTGANAILELDVLSNRPDGQCILGLAREVASILQVEVIVPPADVAEFEKGEAAEKLASVEVLDPKLCPRYTARVIRGVKVGPSPEWLQERLKWIGLQPRNNIVDVTNFICFELNQPLHAFDLKGLSGQKIVVRRAADKEPFTPLYGEIPALTSETLVIADAERPRAVAGVLGGKGSEVTPDTVEILLEAAYFDPANTRRTVRRLKVMEGKGTDSSYRFERGIDVESVEHASARAARLIVQIAGGAIAPGVIDVWPAPRARKTVLLGLNELQRVFGAPIPRQTTVNILTSIGCTIVAEGTHDVHVRIPSWRRGDLEREIDLIEEVARLHGYNHVPATTALVARVPARSPVEVASTTLRTQLTALGYFEVTSDSLVDPKWPSAAVWTGDKPLLLDRASVLREDHSAMRNSLLPSLLSVRALNQNQRTGEVRIFEIGRVYTAGEHTRPDERLVLSLLDDRGFQTLADTLLRFADALDLDGAHLKLQPLVAAPAFLKAGQACRILRVREMTAQQNGDGNSSDERAVDNIGWIGVASQSLQQSFDLRKPVAYAELDLRALAQLPSTPRRYSNLPAYPEITRDIALVVDETVAWNDIQMFAQNWQKHEPLRDPSEAPKFLSVFRGEKIGAGKKSVAFSIQYRAATRTLTDDEVEVAHKKFQQAILDQFKATLRV